MKKIITAVVFFAFSTLSANALDRSSFSVFELTAGLSTNSGVFGADGTQATDTHAGVAKAVRHEAGVFTDSYSSQFIELGIGQWISFGYEHTPDSVSTPENSNKENRAAETKVSVDFNDLNTTYIKINLPVLTGLYAKFGDVETDLDIKETMGTGSTSTYKNVSTSGSMYGLGYSRYLGERGFAFRVEGSYMDLDPVSTDNGIAQGTVSNAAHNETHNKYSTNKMEGLTAKAAITYTFGRNK
jgi:hypothetical protein